MPTPIDDAQLTQFLSEHSAWKKVDGTLERRVKFESFGEATERLVEIAQAADAMNHHPDVHWSYTAVRLTLLTHDTQAITTLDIRLAKEIDRILR